MHYRLLLNDTRDRLVRLIPLYRATKEPRYLYHIKRLLQLRRDIFTYENVKSGKTYHRSTEPYDPCPRLTKEEFDKIHRKG